MGWGDLFAGIVRGVVGNALGDGIADAALSWGGSDEAPKGSQPSANATVDRVLAGRRTELNINDR